jgi:hypothetical protein
MMEKEKMKGLKTLVTERTVFNDEEQRRYVDSNILVVCVVEQYSALVVLYVHRY